MIDMKRKCDYILRLLAMALVSAALAAWPGPFMPEAVRSLAPENTVLHGLETDSVALAGRRGGGGRSGSAPRGSGGGQSCGVGRPGRLALPDGADQVAERCRD